MLQIRIKWTPHIARLQIFVEQRKQEDTQLKERQSKFGLYIIVLAAIVGVLIAITIIVISIKVSLEMIPFCYYFTTTFLFTDLQGKDQ